MKGNIFNIQKFSIHDGPGIRTTVFFKGCPLRCRWCSNPESQLYQSEISYDSRKCIHCGACVKVCPKDCISVVEGQICIDRKKCVSCLSCVSVCSQRAISAESEMRELEKVLQLCLQDKDFYEESGGGVTFSGGECMCQPDFVRALASALKEENIHLAAETTGYIPEESFRELALLFDLLLFDVKHYDSERHREGTRVGNELIISNLRWVHEHGIDILPRIPVIPEFNSDISDAIGICALLKDIGLKKAQLLPFHQFGERKYELLGREYGLKDVKALYPEDLAYYKDIFTKEGIDCFI